MDPLLWSILLITIGLICLTAELFLPSGGILGTLTFAALTAGVIVAFYKGLTYGTAMLLFVSVSLPIFFAAAAKIWPETPMGKWIMLRRPESPEEVLPEQDRGGGLRTLVGSSGVSKSKMLPGGVVSIGGRSYEAVSDGDAIENDQPIVVIGVHLRRLIVRRDDHPQKPPPESSIVAAKPAGPSPSSKSSETPHAAEQVDDPAHPTEAHDHPPIEGMGGIEDPFR